MEPAKHFQLISSNKKDNQSSDDQDLLPQESNYEENIPKENLENKTVLLKIQNDNQIDWFKEDLKNLGIFLNKNFPSNDEKNHKINVSLEFNQIATKFISTRYFFKVINPEWQNYDKYYEDKINPNGLKMKQSILRINDVLNLRSLSCKIHLDLKMQGISMFTILMRSFQNFINEEAYIIQYRKEGYCELSRLSVLLGKIDKNEFIFVKKCEIPIMSASKQLASEDILNIIIEVMDFGNDKIHIFTSVNDKLSKPFKLKYDDLLIPLFENFKMYFLGNGDDTFIKSLLVENFDRMDFFLEKKNKNLCSKCKKCSIF